MLSVDWRRSAAIDENTQHLTQTLRSALKISTHDAKEILNTFLQLIVKSTFDLLQLYYMRLFLWSCNDMVDQYQNQPKFSLRMRMFIWQFHHKQPNMIHPGIEMENSNSTCIKYPLALKYISNIHHNSSVGINYCSTSRLVQTDSL